MGMVVLDFIIGAMVNMREPHMITSIQPYIHTTILRSFLRVHELPHFPPGINETNLPAFNVFKNIPLEKIVRRQKDQ